jgi:hypothetical protein
VPTPVNERIIRGIREAERAHASPGLTPEALLKAAGMA